MSTFSKNKALDAIVQREVTNFKVEDVIVTQMPDVERYYKQLEKDIREGNLGAAGIDLGLLGECFAPLSMLSQRYREITPTQGV